MKRQKAKEGEWLYRDNEDGTRQFAKAVVLPDTADEWQVCTENEKVAYEATWNTEQEDAGGNE